VVIVQKVRNLMTLQEATEILVAGIGGASLGTEIMKCLRLAGRYRIIGCDISRHAYGHYADLASCTKVVAADRYAEAVLDLARRTRVKAVIAGGGEPLRLLNEAEPDFARAGIVLVGNNARTTSLAEDKRAVAANLDAAGILQPRWVAPEHPEDESLRALEGAMVVKPAFGSGASRFVFLVEDYAAASVYVNYLRRNGLEPIVQEYVSEEEGEYSVGALNRGDSSWVGAIVMRRIFVNELSIRSKTRLGLISSAYGQGVFGDFPAVAEAARNIAAALGSTGPLNIQGRMRRGQFIPFEVNARFSGSCFLRALAGFNEADLMIREQLFGEPIEMPPTRFGWGLRGLSEVLVAEEDLK
jgi:carbamoyl-phosphate synthase large subunit